MFLLLKGHAMDALDKLMTRREVAAYLQVQPQTIQAWHYRGQDAPPFIKVGRSVRYKKSDLLAWLWKRAGVNQAAIVIEGSDALERK